MIKKAAGACAVPMGSSWAEDAINFAVYSETANRIFVCIFNVDEKLLGEFELDTHIGAVFCGLFTGVGKTDLYGLRAEGENVPARMIAFDRKRLLVDPWAMQLNKPFENHERLWPSHPANDTSDLVPKALVDECDLQDAPPPLSLKNHGPIYELNVRGFTMRHDSLKQEKRGTIEGLIHPEVVSHFDKLGVSAVELMPIAAWMSERHLLPLGLTNSWGYNPITYFAPDPRLAPNGMQDVRSMTDAYRARDIPVIVDVVYNHTGEGDLIGPTISFKGLDLPSYYRQHSGADGASFINDAGTGNTLQCDHPIVMDLVIQSLRHWVQKGGVSGFRFDLAPILGRRAAGFDADAPLLNKIKQDDVLRHCILIAEPWDPGMGGYQLGQFGDQFLEWNDQYRDKVRGFWAGESGGLQKLAASVSGSRELFEPHGKSTRHSVNFLAAHDGFTLRDLVSYEGKHNDANGEQNRDGHGHNLSWNHGVEGETDNLKTVAARQRDVRALLTTLYVSRGKMMIGQGDEFWRTQQGNNNAYAQDNNLSWIDWANADKPLLGFTQALARLRNDVFALHADEGLSGKMVDGEPDATWFAANGQPMKPVDWEQADAGFVGLKMHTHKDDVLIYFNRLWDSVELLIPPAGDGKRWSLALNSAGDAVAPKGNQFVAPRRSVSLFIQRPALRSKR